LVVEVIDFSLSLDVWLVHHRQPGNLRKALETVASNRIAPEPSSSRARRPTVFVGSCRSLARFGYQRCAKRDVTGHIIMADGSYRTV
jgi:hypothetical protein